jgi:hypothetical protein
MRKVFLLTMVMLLSICLILLGCGAVQEKRISETTGVKAINVTKIVFPDGRGRNKPLTLEDKQKINEFMGLLDGYVIKQEENHQRSTGWIHMADFYNGNQKLMRITFTNPLEIDGVYYNIVKGQLSTETIDKFISSVNSSWKG